MGCPLCPLYLRDSPGLRRRASGRGGRLRVAPSVGLAATRTAQGLSPVRKRLFRRLSVLLPERSGPVSGPPAPSAATSRGDALLTSLNSNAWRPVAGPTPPGSVILGAFVDPDLERLDILVRQFVLAMRHANGRGCAAFHEHVQGAGEGVTWLDQGTELPAFHDRLVARGIEPAGFEPGFPGAWHSEQFLERMGCTSLL